MQYDHKISLLHSSLLLNIPIDSNIHRESGKEREERDIYDVQENLSRSHNVRMYYLNSLTPFDMLYFI